MATTYRKHRQTLLQNSKTLRSRTVYSITASVPHSSSYHRRHIRQTIRSQLSRGKEFQTHENSGNVEGHPPCVSLMILTGSSAASGYSNNTTPLYYKGSNVDDSPMLLEDDAENGTHVARYDSLMHDDEHEPLNEAFRPSVVAADCRFSEEEIGIPTDNDWTWKSVLQDRFCFKHGLRKWNFSNLIPLPLCNCTVLVS